MVFEELTKKHYPNHFKRLQEEGEYKPGSMKRCFSSRRLYIKLDYINIFVEYNGQYLRTGGSQISKGDIVSLLYFNKLEASDKSFFRKNKVNPLDIWIYLDKEINNGWLNEKSSQSLKNISII